MFPESVRSHFGSRVNGPKLRHRLAPKGSRPEFLSAGIRMTRAQLVHEWASKVSSPEEFTLCIQNIPRHCTRAMLLLGIQNVGFGNEYDYLYLPRDYTSNEGRGIAFINIVSRGAARRFVDLMGDLDFAIRGVAGSPSLRVAAAKTQGLANNLVKWCRRHSAQSRDPEMQPFVRALKEMGFSHPLDPLLMQSPPSGAVPYPEFGPGGWRTAPSHTSRPTAACDATADAAAAAALGDTTTACAVPAAPELEPSHWLAPHGHTSPARGASQAAAATAGPAAGALGALTGVRSLGRTAPASIVGCCAWEPDARGPGNGWSVLKRFYV
ncbi:unnamed protein product [Prorocentrum cordatum]|uniref:Mei2-like C-terminal RNA recognition motif domain-containing protein n=1 Tax=Prorocentrum cordatum TaxID=2364126 RepID=A0ABN9XCM0_9DINO|nr:unnamed protein product [Polarella glacialis]